MFSRLLLRGIALALVGFTLASIALADPLPEQRLVKIPILGNPLTSFGGGWVDSALGRYYLGDRSNKAVDVIDTHRNMLIDRIGGFVGVTTSADTSGPNGIVKTSAHELWVADGDSTVKVVDLATSTINDSIDTGGKARADKVAYDPDDDMVAVSNDADHPPFLAFISVPTHKVLGRVLIADATAGIEQSVYDPATGLFYTAIPATRTDTGGEIRLYNAILQFQGAVPLPACGPHGLALGPGHQLLVGCSATAHTLVMDDTTGYIIADLPEAGGSDAVWYDRSNGRYYLAEGGRQYLGVIDARGTSFVQNVQTGIDAHSIAADETLNHAFVPIAAPDPACPQGCIAVFSSVVGDRVTRTP
jgi:DNA-binding beta-propeller fold protein YncE